MANLGLLGDSALRDVLRETAADAVLQPSHLVPRFISCAQFSAWPAAESSTGASDYATVEETASGRCKR